MASKPASRSLQAITRQARPSCRCVNSTSSRTSSIRHFSAPSPRPQAEYETERAERARWSQTPPAMKAPYPTTIKDPEKAWECNSDPARLDAFYIKFLGRGGENVLTEEAKWLAITHKSFDQGRRGFNDRLAFFGRRILNLQTTLALLHSPLATQTQSSPSPYGEGKPLAGDPTLKGLANLSDVHLGEILTKTRLARLASQMGMHEVVRWKPRNPENLDASGVETVLTTTLYAIVGAVALQKGGDVAARVTRERILKPLGIS